MGESREFGPGGGLVETKRRPVAPAHAGVVELAAGAHVKGFLERRENKIISRAGRRGGDWRRAGLRRIRVGDRRLPIAHDACGPRRVEAVVVESDDLLPELLLVVIRWDGC